MRVAIALALAGVLVYKTGNPVLAVTTGALAYVVTCWRLIRDEIITRDKWWAERELIRAFTDAGILPPLKKDQRPWVLRRLGQPQTTEEGTTVTVELPSGIPHTAVTSRHAQLASAMHLPLVKLVVNHEPTDPAGAVRIWVGAKAQPTQAKHARSRLANTDRTTWSDPVRIGRDAKGQGVEWGTAEHNSLVAGVPGSGKTTMGRLPIGHYLLDPTTLVYGMDGKGSRKDYGAVADLSVRWVWGTDDDPASAALEMFTELLGMVQDRNRAGGKKAASDHPGVLLILEEYQDIRAGADKDTREKLDARLGRVIRMGRAVGFHVLISTQRPSVEDFPSGQRNLIDHRACLMVRNGQDAALVLGHTPSLPLPSRRGDAVVALPDRDRQVVLDYLSDDDWEALCARAKKLRAKVEPDAPVCVDSVEPSQVSPLEAAVVAVLSHSPDQSPTALHAALPHDVRPSTPAILGKALAGMGSVELVRTPQARMWRLVDSGRRESEVSSRH